MYKTLTKNGQMFAFGLGLLITIAFLGSIFSGIDAFNALGDKDPARYGTGIFNLGLYAVIALTVLCFAAIVVFGIMHTLGDIKGSMKGLLGFGALLLIFGISYATATVETGSFWDELYKNFNVSPGSSKMISAMITTCLAMIGVAILSVVVSLVRNFFK